MSCGLALDGEMSGDRGPGRSVQPAQDCCCCAADTGWSGVEHDQREDVRGVERGVLADGSSGWRAVRKMLTRVSTPE